MKRTIVARCVVCAMLCALMIVMGKPSSASASLADEKADYVSKFNEAELKTYEDLLGNPEEVGYWSYIDDLDSIDGVVDIASEILGVRPTRETYTQILAEIISLRQLGIAGQIDEQVPDYWGSDAELSLSVLDYVESVAEKVAPESVKPLIKAASKIKGTTIAGAEQSKYYLTVIQDYSDSTYFLQTVADHAEDEQLADVARHILEVNDELLEARLEYLSGNSKKLAMFSAKRSLEIISENAFDMLGIDPDDYILRDFADACGLMFKAASTNATFKFTFGAAILIGDYAFGTTNTFERYQEMKVLADIAQALSTEISTLPTDDSVPSEEAYEQMLAKANLYHLLATVHARGEYQIYRLLVNEGGVLTSVENFFEMFKDPSETTEGWYRARMEVLSDLDESLDYFTNPSFSPVIESFDEMVATLAGSRGVIATGAESYGARSGAFLASNRVTGLLSAEEYDYDDDGDSELLVVSIDTKDGWDVTDSGSQLDADLVIEMYEREGGEVELADEKTIPFRSCPAVSGISSVQVFRGEMGGSPAIYIDYVYYLNDTQVATVCLTYDTSFDIRGGASMYTHYCSLTCYEAVSVEALDNLENWTPFEGGYPGWETVCTKMWGDTDPTPSKSEFAECREGYEGSLSRIGLEDAYPRSSFLSEGPVGSDYYWAIRIRPSDHFSSSDGGDVVDLGGLVSSYSEGSPGTEFTCYDESELLITYR